MQRGESLKIICKSFEKRIFVETAEKWKPRKKPEKKKKIRVEPSKRLDTWMKG